MIDKWNSINTKKFLLEKMHFPLIHLSHYRENGSIGCVDTSELPQRLEPAKIVVDIHLKCCCKPPVN
jgi:hypothetical protein